MTVEAWKENDYVYFNIYCIDGPLCAYPYLLFSWGSAASFLPGSLHLPSLLSTADSKTNQSILKGIVK